MERGNDGWMCVCVSVWEKTEVYRGRGVCEGTIKALYYKSLTVRVCVEITEGCLSPFWLCQNDVCGSFFFPCEILEGGPVCDLSPHVANMFGNSSPLISAHMRYCTWEICGRLRKEAKWPRDTLAHIQMTTAQYVQNVKESPRQREEQATADSDSLLDWGLLYVLDTSD